MAGSLGANVQWLLESRLSRPLTSAENTRLGDTLAEALSVLQSGGDDARRQVLAAPMRRALLSPGAAQVWASAVEAAEGDVQTVSAFCTLLSNSASTIAGVVFATALGM